MLLACAAPQASSAQGSVAANYARANAILDRAIVAHGGMTSLRAAERARVTLEGADAWRNQSARVGLPYDRRRATVEFMIDVPAGRLVFTNTGAYPGDLRFANRRITDGERAFRVNLGANTYRRDRPSPLPELVTAQIFMYLPQLLLAEAAKDRHSLRWLGRVRLASAALVDAIVVGTANGPITLGFEPGSGRLRAYIGLLSDPVAGDGTHEIEFTGYRVLDGLLLPTHRVVWRGGELTQDLRYMSATVNFSVPDSAVAVPAGATEVPRGGDENTVRELGPGVWDIDVGAHVLAVAFADYVVVVETPQGATHDVMETVARLAPGKPIRYAVPTHHHDDHSGGVRDYVAAGIAIVTTPGNQAFLQRMATSRSTLAGDPQTVMPRSPRIEVIAGGRRVFTDGRRTLELHDVGPNEHARELLVAWLPELGIVYEADMINTADNGDVVPGANMRALSSFAAALKQKAWNVTTFAGTHHPPVPAATLEAILKQPIVP